MPSNGIICVKGRRPEGLDKALLSGLSASLTELSSLLLACPAILPIVKTCSSKIKSSMNCGEGIAYGLMVRVTALLQQGKGSNLGG